MPWTRRRGSGHHNERMLVERRPSPAAESMSRSVGTPPACRHATSTSLSALAAQSLVDAVPVTSVRQTRTEVERRQRAVVDENALLQTQHACTQCTSRHRQPVKLHPAASLGIRVLPRNATEAPYMLWHCAFRQCRSNIRYCRKNR